MLHYGITMALQLLTASPNSPNDFRLRNLLSDDTSQLLIAGGVPSSTTMEEKKNVTLLYDFSKGKIQIASKGK